jgi:hypothetical protein
MHDSLPSTGIERRPRQPAADELTAVLTLLRHRLALLVDTINSGPEGADVGVDSLARLREYLVSELNPVLHALALRVRPPLRRLGITGPEADSASEHARLLRLTERAAVVCDEHGTADTAALIDQITRLADRALRRAVDTLPALLAALAPADAARIVAAAERTARAGRHASHLELVPALL